MNEKEKQSEIETAAAMVAAVIFSHNNDFQQAKLLKKVLIEFAHEIKRMAIEP